MQESEQILWTGGKYINSRQVSIQKWAGEIKYT